MKLLTLHKTTFTTDVDNEVTLILHYSYESGPSQQIQDQTFKNIQDEVQHMRQTDRVKVATSCQVFLARGEYKQGCPWW